MFEPKLLTLSVILLSASVVSAQQTASSQRPQQIDFTIAGVGVGSKLDEFHKRLPTAVAGHAPNAVPMQNDHLVVLNNGADQVPTAYFRFLDKAVISIEVYYSALGVEEINAESKMIDQLVERFGQYKKTWRDDRLDGGVDIYTWQSDSRFLSFAMHDDGTAKLFISSNPVPETHPPKIPKTSILGIDPPANPKAADNKRLNRSAQKRGLQVVR